MELVFQSIEQIAVLHEILCSCCSELFFPLEGTLSQDKFHLTFLIQLSDVVNNITMAELIKAQHEELEDHNISTKYIDDILMGKTNQRVLLLIDGYDEYTRETNKDVDRFIERRIGNCFVILTSRPEFVKKPIKSQMDAEAVVKGLSIENIWKYSLQILQDEEKVQKLLKQFVEEPDSDDEIEQPMMSRDLMPSIGALSKQFTDSFSDDDDFVPPEFLSQGHVMVRVKDDSVDSEEKENLGLLHIPIVLLMFCLAFQERGTLPKGKTELYLTIRELIMDRTTPGTFGQTSAEIPNLSSLLHTLGMASWNALQKDVGQLLINTVSSHCVMGCVIFDVNHVCHLSHSACSLRTRSETRQRSSCHRFLF